MDGRFEVGAMWMCKYSGKPHYIQRIERNKKGNMKYWVKGVGMYSASARNSKRSLKALYVPASLAAKVLYGKAQQL